MELFEIIKNAPENSQLITDSIVITHAKLKQYDKILCSVSGGSDSDILVDLCQKFDDADKITYAFFDTGIEFRATKEHIAFLEQKYNIHIEHIKAVKPIPICCKTYGQPFLSKQVSEWIERLQRHDFKWEDKPFDILYKEYPKCIPVIIQEIVNKVILKTLNKRNRYDEKINMQYKQLLFLTYKDGAPMLTIGGILVDDVLKEKIDNTNVLEKLVYCSFGDKYFSIEIPKLTYKEIQVVLKNIPITDEEYEKNKDNFYGIELDEIRKFEKIYRYYPYYTEGCLNT